MRQVKGGHETESEIWHSIGPELLLMRCGTEGHEIESEVAF